MSRWGKSMSEKLSQSHTPAALPEIIDRVLAVCDVDRVTIDDLVTSVGRGGFAALLLLPALAVATPLSGIPLFSSLMGIVIALVAVQMLLRRRYLWLPAWILQRTVDADKVARAFTRIRPAMVWIEDRTRQRFRAFVQFPFVFVPQVLCFMSGAIMPVLEFVPFSSSVLGIGVALLTLGMLTRDGIVAILALVPYLGVGALVYQFV